MKLKLITRRSMLKPLAVVAMPTRMSCQMLSPSRVSFLVSSKSIFSKWIFNGTSSLLHIPLFTKFFTLFSTSKHITHLLLLESKGPFSLVLGSQIGTLLIFYSQMNWHIIFNFFKGCYRSRLSNISPGNVNIIVNKLPSHLFFFYLRFLSSNPGKSTGNSKIGVGIYTSVSQE